MNKLQQLCCCHYLTRSRKKKGSNRTTVKSVHGTCLMATIASIISAGGESIIADSNTNTPIIVSATATTTSEPTKETSTNNPSLQDATTIGEEESTTLSPLTVVNEGNDNDNDNKGIMNTDASLNNAHCGCDNNTPTTTSSFATATACDNTDDAGNVLHRNGTTTYTKENVALADAAATLVKDKNSPMSILLRRQIGKMKH